MAVTVAPWTAFVGLGRKGLWFDEAYTVAIARLDFSSLMQALTRQEAFFALHYLLMYPWIRLGDGDAWVRAPSALFAVGAVYAMFFLAYRLFGMRTGLIASFLLAINPFFLRYAQEARSYSLTILAVTLATLAFVIAVDRRTAKGWACYGAAAAFAIYAHPFAALVVVAHIVAITMRTDRPSFRHVALGYGVCALLIAPLVSVVLASGRFERPFIPRLSLGWVAAVAVHLIGGEGERTWRALLLLAVVSLLVAAALAGASRTSSWPTIVVLAWLLVPVVVMATVSIVRPVLYPRYLAIVVPALALAVAVGIDRLRFPPLRVLVGALVVALSLPSTVSYLRADTKEDVDFPAAVAQVVRRAHPGDGIVFLSRYGRYPFEHYLENTGKEEALLPLFPGKEWGRQQPVVDDAEPTNTAARELAVHPRRVWTVLLWGGFASRHQDGALIENVLSRRYRQSWAGGFGAELEVRLYEPA